MAWAGMENLDDDPINLTIPPIHGSKDKKQKFVENTIGYFVEQYVLSEFDVEKAWREDIEKAKNEERERQSKGNTIHDTPHNFSIGMRYPRAD